jgi:hypothetical protein
MARQQYVGWANVDVNQFSLSRKRDQSQICLAVSRRDVLGIIVGLVVRSNLCGQPKQNGFNNTQRKELQVITPSGYTERTVSAVNTIFGNDNLEWPTSLVPGDSQDEEHALHCMHLCSV